MQFNEKCEELGDIGTKILMEGMFNREMSARTAQETVQKTWPDILERLNSLVPYLEVLHSNDPEYVKKYKSLIESLDNHLFDITVSDKEI